MTRFWKGLILLNVIISCISLLYLYTYMAENPYDSVHYEIKQIQVDIGHLKDDTNRMEDDVEALKADIVPRK